jgi:hypothetical protein
MIDKSWDIREKNLWNMRKWEIYLRSGVRKWHCLRQIYAGKCWKAHVELQRVDFGEEVLLYRKVNCMERSGVRRRKWCLVGVNGWIVTTWWYRGIRSLTWECWVGEHVNRCNRIGNWERRRVRKSPAVLLGEERIFRQRQETNLRGFRSSNRLRMNLR